MEALPKTQQNTTNQLELQRLAQSFAVGIDISQSSQKLYSRVLRLYFDYLSQIGLNLDGVAISHLIAYKQHLIASGLKPSSVCFYLSVIRKFYQWTEASRLYPDISKTIENPYRDTEPKRFPLTIPQSMALMEVYKNNKRDFAIITLLLRTGLRAIEVTRANVEDIGFLQGRRVLFVQGKGRLEKTDFVVLTDNTYQTISDYLAERGPLAPGSPLFCGNSNNNQCNRLTTRAIRYIGKIGLKRIGIDDRRFTTHSLRHTAGTRLYEATGDIELVRKTMRHRDTSTTLHYTKTIETEMRLRNPGEDVLATLF
jgi:site-specific recombinase XerD